MGKERGKIECDKQVFKWPEQSNHRDVRSNDLSRHELLQVHDRVDASLGDDAPLMSELQRSHPRCQRVVARPPGIFECYRAGRAALPVVSSLTSKVDISQDTLWPASSKPTHTNPIACRHVCLCTISTPHRRSNDRYYQLCSASPIMLSLCCSILVAFVRQDISHPLPGCQHDLACPRRSQDGR